MKKVIGVGSPIVDLLAQVPDEHVDAIDGEKGGMELVDPQGMEQLVDGLIDTPALAPGGSAGNTAFALARMGVPSAFLGKVGEDVSGRYYREAFEQLGGDTSHFKLTAETPTARCLSLITPDSQRTLRTDLGAAALLSPEEVGAEDFANYDHVHIEGYLLFNRDLAEAVLAAAKEAGCTVSLDLGSFEVVRAAEDILPRLLEDYVDCVFANEDEAIAYCGDVSPEEALETFGKLCETAAVKLGPEGAWIQRGEERHFVPAQRVDSVIDTTGAGDLWAAGFLYGYARGWPLDACAKLGSVLGAEVVQRIGADLDAAGWDRVHAAIGEHE